MFFPVFLHVFNWPNKGDGLRQVARKTTLAKGSHVPTKHAGGPRVGHGANPQRRETGMSDEKKPIDPNRLTPEQAAKLLSAAAKIRIPEENIALDIDSGAPTNQDGSINLVHYIAWMVKEMGRGE
jgi:hypothetical protein